MSGFRGHTNPYPIEKQSVARGRTTKTSRQLRLTSGSASFCGKKEGSNRTVEPATQLETGSDGRSAPEPRPTSGAAWIRNNKRNLQRQDSHSTEEGESRSAPSNTKNTVKWGWKPRTKNRNLLHRNWTRFTFNHESHHPPSFIWLLN
jgi:hypothetical protein